MSGLRIFPAIALLFITALPADQAMAVEPVSGYEFLTPETRAMQDDEFENPGMVAVERGEALFREHRQDEEYACAGCHEAGDGKLDPSSIAAYPRYDPNLGGLVTLQDQIGHCWEIHLDRFPLPYDHPHLVDLETYIRHLARGEPVNVSSTGPIAELLRQGEELYRTRFGQLDISCAHCHVQHQGQMLRGQQLSQGQANGFPEYRLGKGSITSLHKRLRQCFVSFRAEPFDPGSREFKLLELYLMSRGNGLKIETPAVRF
jgi:sulfur-oxidizing protein SoxA